MVVQWTAACVCGVGVGCCLAGFCGFPICWWLILGHGFVGFIWVCVWYEFCMVFQFVVVVIKWVLWWWWWLLFYFFILFFIFYKSELWWWWLRWVCGGGGCCSQGVGGKGKWGHPSGGLRRQLWVKAWSFGHGSGVGGLCWALKLRPWRSWVWFRDGEIRWGEKRSKERLNHFCKK